MFYIKFYLDDIRDCPIGWVCKRNFHEAITYLDANLSHITDISLDHDIASFYGNKEMTGYDVLMWLLEQKLSGREVTNNIKVHSANPVGAERMNDVINKHFR